ncbi:transient receptor potential cation channel protein painless-like [Drosophila takahashii]|uniref:transient receptor potential cation channel protein painless-like n=1 Tax=Drosophila takahashii TaxID=29030 RepID=UPI0038995F96
MDPYNAAFVEGQDQLATALAKQDIRAFVAALDGGAQADLRDERSYMSIYEQALSTPGCSAFIEACIDHGSPVNHIDRNYLMKAPLHYAADSKDPGNIAALLKSRPGKDKVWMNRIYIQLTALNSLAKNLTEENAPEVLSCMRLLLEYGASPNMTDHGGITPLHHVLMSKVEDQKPFVQLFLANPKLNIDCYRYGEVRRLLQLKFPELPLPVERQGKIDRNRLEKTLMDGDEDLFEKQFAKFLHSQKGGAVQEDFFGLLSQSIRSGRQRAFEIILDSNVVINFCHGGSTVFNLLELAILLGNWQALERLLKEPNLRLTPLSRLVNMAIFHLENSTLDADKHQRCFEVLLDCDRVDINEADPGHWLPLSYAAKLGSTLAMRKLLERGAYIGSKCDSKALPIKYIPHKVLKEHFDSCITASRDDPGAQGYAITFDYRNLIDFAEISKHDEMRPIAFMARSKEMRYFLQHPLISSLLLLKWNRLSIIFYLNLLLYSFFAVSLITHTILKVHDAEPSIFILFSWMGIGYLILREAIQCMIDPIKYLRSMTNNMVWALIILSIFSCLESAEKETERVLAAFTILLASVEFCRLVGSVPVLSISTHMLMLREVSTSFVKSFSLYSIFVLTFSLCFYILFGQPASDSAKEEYPNFDFTTPFVALAKTIVMMTGELNSGELKFTTVYTYLIFVLFVLFMTIVLINLLNGLALSDTQEIKKQAELNGDICRTNLLCRYERVLTGRRQAGLFKNNRLLSHIYHRFLHINPNFLSQRKISILPNDGNKVLMTVCHPCEMRNFGFQKWFNSPQKIAYRCCSKVFGRRIQMDDRTVMMALEVLDQNNSAKKMHKLEEIKEEQQREKEEVNDSRLRVIENRLEEVIMLLKDRN